MKTKIVQSVQVNKHQNVKELIAEMRAELEEEQRYIDDLKKKKKKKVKK